MVAPVSWSPKDPDETGNYELDWLPLGLAAGDTIASSEWLNVSGVTVISDNVAASATATIITLSGGIVGSAGVLTNRIVTVAGETLEQVVVLPIVASDVPPPLVGYDKPTPGHFAAQYPRFAAVPYLTLQAYLTRAAERVDETWTQGDYAPAMMLYAAHLLTLDGQGSGTEAQLAAEGLGGFQRIRSGSLDLQQFDRTKTVGGNTLSMTSYGTRFAELQRLNFAGARIVPGHFGRRSSPAATDC